MKKLAILLFGTLVLFLFGCGTSGHTSATQSRANDIENPDIAISLVEHLRRVPGVQVKGSGTNASIVIRGIASITSGTEPLFVVDGQPLAGGLQYASQMVPVHDIKSIRVLKNAGETGIYGVRGANGVIEIYLKKQ